MIPEKKKEFIERDPPFDFSKEEAEQSGRKRIKEATEEDRTQRKLHTYTHKKTPHPEKT